MTTSWLRFGHYHKLLPAKQCLVQQCRGMVKPSSPMGQRCNQKQHLDPWVPKFDWAYPLHTSPQSQQLRRFWQIGVLILMEPLVHLQIWLWGTRSGMSVVGVISVRVKLACIGNCIGAERCGRRQRWVSYAPKRYRRLGRGEGGWGRREKGRGRMGREWPRRG